MNGLPLTNYHINQFKKIAGFVVTILIVVVIIGNLVSAIFETKVRVDKKSYTLKSGFPIFNSYREYLNIVKKYPHEFGIKITIHKMNKGESYWDVAREYHLNVETLIAANPFIKNLEAEEDMEIVVPETDGVLLPLDNTTDVWRMKKLLGFTGKIGGEYLPSIFDIITTDQIRFAFFKGVQPVIVNNELQRLCDIRRQFHTPLKGHYTSLYGDRVDPFVKNMAFHNGIDISSPTGTDIYPARDGIVSYTGWLDGYGFTVKMQHTDGYITMYGHCSKILTQSGTFVTTKDVIAKVGSTGRSTGPHLHFSMFRHGVLLNPLLYIW